MTTSNMIKKREDIVKIICDTLDVNYSNADRCVVTILDNIMGWVANGDSIQLRNFGTLFPQLQKERLARSIKECKMVSVPQRIKPKFRASKTFYDKCNHR